MTNFEKTLTAILSGLTAYMWLLILTGPVDGRTLLVAALSALWSAWAIWGMMKDA